MTFLRKLTEELAKVLREALKKKCTADAYDEENPEEAAAAAPVAPPA